MTTYYNVVHVYEVDGGYGDAVHQTEIVASFSTKAQAELYVEMYGIEDGAVYDAPYARLTAGELEVVPVEILTDAVDAPRFDPFNDKRFIQYQVDYKDIDKRFNVMVLDEENNQVLVLPRTSPRLEWYTDDEDRLTYRFLG